MAMILNKKVTVIFHITVTLLNLLEESYFSFWVFSEYGNEIKIYNFSQSNATKAKRRHADHFFGTASTLRL